MKQEDILRLMIGEQRIEQAFELSEFVRSLAVTNIKNTASGPLTKEQLQNELYKRLYCETMEYSRRSKSLLPCRSATLWRMNPIRTAQTSSGPT